MRAVRLALLLVGTVLATAGSGARAGIPESKQQLIRELLEISSGTQATEQVAQMFLLQLRSHHRALVDQVVASEAGLTAEEQQALRAHLLDFDEFATTFSARFPERIDLDSVLVQVYTPLYDRYFDESELRTIVAFYRSPAGRKTLTVMPILLQEGIRDTLPVVEPRVMELVGEILAERSSEILR